VAVWTARQTAEFLASIQDHRLSAASHLIRSGTRTRLRPSARSQGHCPASAVQVDAQTRVVGLRPGASLALPWRACFDQAAGSGRSSRTSCAQRHATAILAAHCSACSREGTSTTANPPMTSSHLSYEHLAPDPTLCQKKFLGTSAVQPPRASCSPLSRRSSPLPPAMSSPTTLSCCRCGEFVSHQPFQLTGCLGHDLRSVVWAG